MLATKNSITNQIKRINDQLGERRFTLVKLGRAYTLKDTKGEIHARKLDNIERELRSFENGLVFVPYSYSLNEPSENVINNIIGKRYNYFHFSKESAQKLAETPIEDIKWNDAVILVQALFPSYLVCGGIVDCFVIFECQNGVRKDPPKFWYCDFSRRVNNCHNKNQITLIEAILNLFKANGISYHESWEKYYEKTK